MACDLDRFSIYVFALHLLNIFILLFFTLAHWPFAGYALVKHYIFEFIVWIQSSVNFFNKLWIAELINFLVIMIQHFFNHVCILVTVHVLFLYLVGIVLTHSISIILSKDQIWSLFILCSVWNLVDRNALACE